MLQREKDWVSKIQMMQLQSTDPYLDDFYYQNYFEKLEKLSAAEEMQGDGPKKERTKLITPQVAKLEHTYKPGEVASPRPRRGGAPCCWWDSAAAVCG